MSFFTNKTRVEPKILKNWHYGFDATGKLQNFGSEFIEWAVELKERENLIPDIRIKHYHRTSDADSQIQGDMCSCGERQPINILSDAIISVTARHRDLYAAIEIADGRLRSMKPLAENWLLNQNKSQKEPSLYHICHPTHPGNLFYGKGIPLSYLDVYPHPDKCKTCLTDIPTGIRMALLMIRSKLKL